jgi:hypothetical protein
MIAALPVPVGASGVWFPSSARRHAGAIRASTAQPVLNMPFLVFLQIIRF